MRDFLWQGRFALEVAASGPARGDVLRVAASPAQCAGAVVQVLFAINERYWTGDTRALEELGRLPLAPEGCAATVHEVLTAPGSTPVALAASMRRMEALVGDVESLVARAG